MRNLKKALSLALASVMLLGMMVVGTSAAYSDVAATDNVEAIEVLKMVGVMSGDENGNFNPAKGVTRNEMAVVMANLMDLDITDYKGSSPFTDLAAWAEPYVAACYANGIVSGTTATTYGGNGTVTTAQAALMLMKGLGYFQYGSDFGADWQLATVKKGSEINLFDGIDTGASAALTRNDVAQMVLNALKANVVTATVSGNNTQIEAGDVNITVTANVTYNPVTTWVGTNYDQTLVNPVGTTTQQLAEKLYDGNLTVNKDAFDAFDRPATLWTYVGDTTETVEVADKPVKTYTAAVKGGKIYTDLGKPTVTTMTYSANGGSTSNIAANIVSGNTTSYGANGTALEVYKLSTGNYVMVEIDTYVSTIATHSAAVKDKDGDITTKERITLTGEAGYFETTDFEKADATDGTTVLYTKLSDGTIKSVKAAESKNLVASWKDATSFKADGATYKYSANAAGAIANADVTGKTEKVVYFDEYGYVIKVANPTAEDPDYAYVMAIDSEVALFGDPVYYAKLLYVDGTIEAVKIPTADNGLNGKLVSYAEITSGSDKGKIDLTEVASSYTGSFSVAKNSASLQGALVNDKTIFVVETTKDGDKVYTVYTGVRNVPALTCTKVSGVTDVGVWTVFYAMDATLTASSSTAEDVIYVDASSEKNAVDVDGSYYTYKAIVNGEIVDTYEATVSGLGGLYGSVTKNDDGRVTAGTALSGTDIALVSETGTAAASKGLIALGSTSYIYDDATTVYVIDVDGNIAASSISAIEADANDVVEGYTTKGVLTMVIITEVA